MLEGYTPLVQALFGTLFTWAVTAAGALTVVFFKGTQPKLLDGSLGFAAGVMTAASYWSLLAPAIEMSEGPYAFIPACVGFLLGAGFTFAADIIISKMGIESPNLLLASITMDIKKMDDIVSRHRNESTICESCRVRRAEVTESSLEEGNVHAPMTGIGSVARKRGQVTTRHPKPEMKPHDARLQWKRILLLIIAITVHNIPEGLAVGVAFGALGNNNSTTFKSARNLAIGIGIQNFPEGLAVSLPLKAAGFSTLSSFWYGQLSGMVEPVFGLVGAILVSAAQPILPYAMAFAAGAMIYVVVDDIIPEANTKGNGSLASWGAIFGFMVMMMLEVGLSS
ncbi:zinc transporter ZIP11 isoform X1 [Cimex lectularius]|uniref:Zinc transporter ZIP11 n=1 Tax=Cimex lectularius TaxID=79782 RepID=A0A8I6RSM2_CIMLE|nr:zinc transporter ZIP11 isoform X1 [Cimex lectularius]